MESYFDPKSIWDTLDPSQCLNAREHFCLVSELMRDGMSQHEFSTTFLRSFSFQTGNLSKLERHYLKPFASHAYAYLFDPGYERDSESIRRFAEQDWFAFEEQIDQLLGFLSRNPVLFPRRFALVDWNPVETGRFGIMEDGTKGITVSTTAESVARSLKPGKNGLTFSQIVRLDNLDIWWEEDYTCLIEERADRVLNVFGKSGIDFLISDPWTNRIELKTKNEIGELIKTESEIDPLPCREIWGAWGPSNITHVLPSRKRR